MICDLNGLLGSRQFLNVVNEEGTIRNRVLSRGNKIKTPRTVLK